MVLIIHFFTLIAFFSGKGGSVSARNRTGRRQRRVHRGRGLSNEGRERELAPGRYWVERVRSARASCRELLASLGAPEPRSGCTAAGAHLHRDRRGRRRTRDIVD